MQGAMSGEPLFQSVLNILPQQLCVLNETGVIEWVNEAWIAFAVANGGDASNVGLGVNYLNMCLAQPDDVDASVAEASRGIRAVIENKSPLFSLDYPCHSPTEKRWFMMEIKPMMFDGRRIFVVSHQDITERKLAEGKVQALAVIDGLTGISNRRGFDEFLSREWRRAQRFHLPVSLALLDIDFFKQFNDNYGHVAGDECLTKVGAVLKGFARRPGDLVARYGGEEFSIIMGETDLAGAEMVAETVRAAILDLNISHNFAGADTQLTISAGVAMAYPHDCLSEIQLIEAADLALFDAKRSGRNRVSVNSSLIAGEAGIALA